jgi:Tol biopolymer transport system component
MASTFLTSPTAVRPIPNLQVGAQIVIRSLATGEEREIIPKLSSFILPDWSPDGRYFLTSGRDWQGQGGVFKIDANTGETTTIFAYEPDTDVGNPVLWSRDGKSIFYSKHHYSEKRRTLELRNLETGRVKELFRTVEPNEIRKLSLSRDGRFLAFLLRNWKTDVEVIHLVPVAGSKSRQLLQVHKPEYLVASFEWTLDDKEILFAKGRETETEDIFELMRISSEGGEPRRLGLAQNQRIRDLRLHPDGSTLVFTVGQTRETEVWAMDGFLPEHEGS